MPSKINLDENLWFLYTCLQKSDLKTIDFAAVAQHTNLKPPAARMRFTRLKRQIESGTRIGKGETPFTEKTRRGKNKSSAGNSDDEHSESEYERTRGRAKRKRFVEQGSGQDGKTEAARSDREGNQSPTLKDSTKAKTQVRITKAAQSFASSTFGAFKSTVQPQAYIETETKLLLASPFICPNQPFKSTRSNKELLSNQAIKDSRSEDDIPLAKLHKRNTYYHPPKSSPSPWNHRSQVHESSQIGAVGRADVFQIVGGNEGGRVDVRWENDLAVHFPTPPSNFSRGGGRGLPRQYMGHGRASRFLPRTNGITLERHGPGPWEELSSFRSFSSGVRRGGSN